ncbi:MAG: PucR family transcriptional regulator ligand-binding domain-containing protein, partial [Thermovirgaceae bacterium]|nr:PucR family transcriptional regulator ligand-binding domain-containing protein [Thermovirgaceae bacterium]
MIVADLFRKDVFPDFQIIAGTEGMKREISAVSVIDSPDVDRWMRGGELLIGSGYIFREDPEEMTPFLRLVAARNIAALGIKIDRYHTTLPRSLIEEAEKMGVPLIEIPLKYRWIDIIELVHGILMREQLLLESGADSPVYLWNESWDMQRLVSGLA